VQSLSLRFHLLLAAALCAVPIGIARAQSAPSAERPVVGLHDSIDVASLKFDGAQAVTPDELKLIVFTRTSSCRLVLIAPLCKLSRSQLFIDRRRTTPAALGEDITKIRVYYWRRGFRDAQVDTVLTPARHGMNVAFRIVEGEPTRIGTLDVEQRAPVLSEKELSDAVVVHAGEPLDLIALDTTLNRLRDAVWNKGYGDVRVDTTVPRADASHVVPVRIDVDPKYLTRVGQVNFEGNRAISDAALRRGTMLQPGTLYTRDAVLESQRHLMQQPLLARAVVVTPPAGDSVKTITVAVAEQKPRHVDATLGFNTIEFGQASLDLRHNALGGGRWLRLYGSVGNLFSEQLNGWGIFQQVIPEDPIFDADPFVQPAYEASLTLTQPWIAGARTSASVRAFANRRILTGVAVDQSVGGFVGIAHDIAPRAPIGLNYRLEAVRVEAGAVYFCAGYGICDAATIQALSNTQRLAPIGASAWIDRSDDLDSPTHGYTALLDAEHASRATGSTFEFNRILGDASYYKPLGAVPSTYGITKPPKVLAFHLRAGMMRPMDSDRTALGVATPGEGIAHPRTLFYAGGMQSVRGFAENELGPRVLQVRASSLLAAGCTLATIVDGTCNPNGVPNDAVFPVPTGGSSLLEGSVELRMPLRKNLTGVAFVDAGHVGTTGLATVGQAKGAVTPGFGFRYRSPLGVIRLDFGLRPVGEEQLPVVVAIPDATGQLRIVQLQQEKSYSPVENPSPGTWRAIGRRIVVHFAMGQAF
jgi:outer membrane protein insertion porin family